MNNIDSDDDDDSSIDVAFANMDMAGVDFDDDEQKNNDKSTIMMTALDRQALEMEHYFLIDDYDKLLYIVNGNTNDDNDNGEEVDVAKRRLYELVELLVNGKYTDALRSDSAKWLLSSLSSPEPVDASRNKEDQEIENNDETNKSQLVSILQNVFNKKIQSVSNAVEALFIGIAALNLFIQLNYTGPHLEENVNNKENELRLEGIHPHECFSHILSSSNGDNKNPIETTSSNKTSETTLDAQKTNTSSTSDSNKEEGDEEKLSTARKRLFHNSVLSELSVEGIWPCQVAKVPYMLLLARVILSTISASVADEDSKGTTTMANEMANSKVIDDRISSIGTANENNSFSRFSHRLSTVCLWSARTIVTHERLLLIRDQPTETLWYQVQSLFERCLVMFQTPPLSPKTSADDEMTPQNDGELKEDENDDHIRRLLYARILLEYGLAHYHFDRYDDHSTNSSTSIPVGATTSTDPATTKKRLKGGKHYFELAKSISGLSIEVTGAMGKRTKFQQFTTAQMVVRAKSSSFSLLQQQKERRQGTQGEIVRDETVNETESKVDSQTNLEGEEERGKEYETTKTINDENNDNNNNTDVVKSQMIEHSDDNILLERVKFDDQKENQVTELTILDQSILLGFCLDVKRTNPTTTSTSVESSGGLTGEEMLAYLARVLCHHDDWMVYATALLERAWIEFQYSTHTKERSLLQMQALADQHTNRLTMTQSTKKSIEEDSSPVQDRIRNIHDIVYPPRWHMLRDVAERYSQLGIVTSAAEIFTEIEFWDDVVDCYKRAGKEQKALSIVQDRLKVNPNAPRMWVALGDLTKDPQHYEKAIELSKGRFSDAYIALGHYYFDLHQDQLTTAKTVEEVQRSKECLSKAAESYRRSLKLRPLQASIWFRAGTIYMQLEDWESALLSFSEVVQQQPDEAEAWANVAAVHMHNKHPDKAYPALVESIKQNRNSWRVWVSKLYTCLDLKKFDEATQACLVLLDMKAKKAASQGVPELEERCIRAIVGGTIEQYHEAREHFAQVKHNNNAVSSKTNNLNETTTMKTIQEDETIQEQVTNKGTDDEEEEDNKNEHNTIEAATAALDSARRTLMRVHELLQRISSSSTTSKISQTWIYETTAFFHQQIGQDEQVYENLMKEFRALQSVRGWETDDHQVRKICQVVTQIVHFQQQKIIQDQSKKDTTATTTNNDDTESSDSNNNKKVVIPAKLKLLLNGVIKKVKKSRVDQTKIPQEVSQLEDLITNFGAK